MGNCYWLAAAQSVALDAGRIKDIFMTDTYTNEGIFAVKLFIKGKPEIITIDDFLPWKGTSPFSAKRSDDGDIWMSILEKAFAKINGNYESMGGGWQSESWRILNGAPSRFYILSNLNANSQWNLITDSLNRGYLVGVDSPGGTSTFGIASGHAHSIVGAYTLKDAYGNVK